MAELSRLLQLEALVATVPIPTNRPPIARRDELVGLTLLDLVLRLEHVSRVSESLRYLEQGSLRRSLSLDVDLRRLTSKERAALQLKAEPGTSDAEATGFWLPISRYRRSDIAPVIVRNSSGDVVPRLTQRATSAAVVAGLARLFKMLSASGGNGGGHGQGTRRPPGEVADQRATWLVQSAIVALVAQGPLQSAEPRNSSATTACDQPVRDRARDALREVAEGPHGDGFEGLLNLVCEEHFLIVLVQPEPSHVQFSFEAPLVRADDALAHGFAPHGASSRRPGACHPKLRQLRRAHSALDRVVAPWRLPSGRDLRVRYNTSIPRRLSSYHLTLEVDDEVLVRHFLLTTDADSAALEELRTEIGEFAQRIRVCVPAEWEALKLEWNVLRGKLTEVLRRRELEYARFFETYQGKADPPISRARRLSLLATKLTLAEGRMQRVTDVRHKSKVDQLVRTLEACCDAVLASEVDRDAHFENDPRENGAHAQWSQEPISFGPPTLAPIEAKVLCVLADEKPALSDSVRAMLWGLLAVVAAVTLGYVTATYVDENLLGGLQSDALVTVLLLIPGILLSRLDIPRTHSVLGRLRERPRRLAQTAVFVTSALAVAVACMPWQGAKWKAGTLALVLLALLVAAHQRGHAARQAEGRGTPAVHPVPAWLLRRPGKGGNEVQSPWLRGRVLQRVARSLGLAFPVDREEVNENFAANREPASASDAAPQEADRKHVSRSPGGTPAASGQEAPLRTDGLRLRRASDLASAAARELARRSPSVRLLVSHGTGPTCKARHVDESDHVDERMDVHLCGLHAHAVLDTGDPSEVLSVSQHETAGPCAEMLDQDCRGDVHFPGVRRNSSGRPPLTGLWTLEALVEVSSGSSMAFVHDLLTSVLQPPIARDVTLRGIHFPESAFKGPVLPDGSCQAPRPAADNCVRLLISGSYKRTRRTTGNGSVASAVNGGASTRLDILMRLVAFCADRGVRLHVTEHSAGAGPYEWRQFFPTQGEASGAAGSPPATGEAPVADALPSRRPSVSWAFTLVARGSVVDSIALSRAFSDTACRALSGGAMAGVPVLSVQLDDPHAPSEDTRRRSLSGDDARQQLERLVGSDKVKLLTAYDVTASGPYAVPPARSAPGRRSALWVSWLIAEQDRATGAPRRMLDVVRGSFDRDLGHGDSTVVEYSRERRARDGGLQGHAKLSVSTDDLIVLAARREVRADLLQVLGDVCKRAQDHTVNELLSFGLLRHSVDVQVVSRESWLTRHM